MDIPATSHSLLVALRLGGSGSAWNSFVARYRDLILTWCQRRGLKNEAEDLTQEILLKLLHRLPRYVHDPARGQFRGWLKTVVENTLRDFRRKQQRHPRPAGVGGSAFLHRLENVEDMNREIDELSMIIGDEADSDTAEIVTRARSRVSEKTWQAFIQLSYEKRPAAQVAEELGLTTATVFKHAYRVKRILMEEMDNPSERPRR